jgi:PAS domain S-box-containing protein
MEHETLELQTILDTMADGLFVIDREHRVVRWNRSMERLTGYSAAEMLGNSCTVLRCNRGDVKSQILGMLDCEASARGQVEGQEVLIRRKDGGDIALMVSARMMQDDTGAVEGTVVTFTDISHLRQLESENRHLRELAREEASFHNIVGRSARMREVFRLIELAAASDESILILGETGTGKELVARAIHFHSSRREGPLVSVNCSALSESLLESELFGHVKGAFTGAIRDYVGRFESAGGGTLFLDEIGELPPLVQVKLLRVLQEHTVERVGEGLPRKVDVRVIAATHRDLREQLRLGEFREDLFYRLNVFPIRLPALRDRKEDLELLLAHFIDKFQKRTGKTITGLAPDALRILMDHNWPGNVRELENAVAHAFVTCPGGLIGPFDLPIELRQVELRVPSSSPRMTAEPIHGPVSREALLRLLEECDWNKAEVARRLDMDRTSVWRRMKSLDIPLRPS